MTKKEIIKRLNEITRSFSFINILSKIVIRDFCGSIDVLFSKNNMEHLNHKEFSFLIGLWLKNINGQNVFDDKKHLEDFKEVYELMDKLHYTFLEDFKFDPNKKVDSYEYFTNGNMFQETMFYSGSGAYDIQYKKTTLRKYKYDRDWIFENKKFEIASLSEFYDNVKNKLQEKLNSRQFNKNIGREIEVLLNDGTEIEGELQKVETESITLILKYRKPKEIGKGKVDVVEEREIPYTDIKKALVAIKF